MGRYKHKPVKPKYKKEGEGFWRKTKPRDRIVGKSRAAKGGGTEPLPSEQSKVDRRGRKAAAANEGKKSTVGGGEQGVRTEYLIPKHMKAPKKKSKSSTKKTRKGSPTSLTEKAGVAQDIGPWKPTDRKATKPKVSYKKPKKTPFGMKKGGSVDAQWGGYNFKDGGRIPGIRPTRKGT